ncbi:MAG TPA: hypothetical protein VHZ78_07365 [Rhizomicrobium sp.]|jgi:hypothetical protein|nr:hypothetical protein [Rhizomicrobium sp.]
MSDWLRGSYADKRVRTPIAAQERAFVFRNNIVKLWTPCRQAERTTVYDMQHLDIFNRLLNAEYDGASHGEMAQFVFGIDAALYPNWAAAVVNSHLERAHWLRDKDFPYLDW